MVNELDSHDQISSLKTQIDSSHHRMTRLNQFPWNMSLTDFNQAVQQSNVIVLNFEQSEGVI